MTASPDTPPAGLLDLVKRFEEIADGTAYNETTLRRTFLDPLFQVLGWDVENKQGVAEAYKDVVHEDAIKIGGHVKAPDYCFRLGGTRKFFVEAKRPSVNIREDADAAFQVRRYAWSAKLPLAILTNFGGLSVYDSRIRPRPDDAAHVARILHLHYTEYATRWSEVTGMFSRAAVLGGAIEAYAKSTAKKKGISEVDDAFLDEIELWREQLAKNIALRNQGLDERSLNFAVQRTIDRIVFLRICEDRGIEEDAGLLSVVNGTGVYPRLLARFKKADARYNSGLFHFADEKGRPTARDDLTPRLVIDDSVIKAIILELYPPKSPYAFAVLPSDILGQVYERFLGKVIRLTPGHQAKVEEKPEVRKAGGVYYTPTYIVEHITDQTLRPLLKGATPLQVGALTPTWQRSKAKGAQPLTVLDPACGSGSFLLGAYRYLLDWYREEYMKTGKEGHAAGGQPRLYQHASGEWRLTTSERKRILTSHIYGVDIDPQAVEVTKLSLLLAVLEGENDETIASQLRLFQERALPDLEENIRCGNSLIGSDFWQQQALSGIDVEHRYQVNSFDWDLEFPSIMKSGGFNAVIGNPPYLSYSGRQAIELPADEKAYFESNYASAAWPTAHGFFVERAIAKLAKNVVSYIVPDQVGHLDGYQAVRDVLHDNSVVSEVRYWGEEVFRGVITPALTFVARKLEKSVPTSIVFNDGRIEDIIVKTGSKWVAPRDGALLAKISGLGRSLEKLVADPGVHTGNCSEKLIVPLAGAKRSIVPVLEGKQIFRFECLPPVKGLNVSYVAGENEYFRIADEEKFTNASFVIRQTAAFPIVGPRENATYFRNSLLALYSPPEPVDVRFIVGILNSKLMRYYYTQTVQESGQRAFPQVKVGALRRLPIAWPDLNKPKSKARHDAIVNGVQKMIDLSRAVRAAGPAHTQTVLRRDLEATDKALDSAVFELYTLTANEIALVESATSIIDANE